MKLLDLFCGAGGAAMGYHRAGFDEIVGVDNKLQPHYPFDFVFGDALRPPVDLAAVDLIHASPPCQAYSVTRHLPNARGGPDLVGATRELLRASGKPYIIENVPGAPLQHYVKLWGPTFGLKVFRERWFETHPLILVTPPAKKPQNSTTHSGHGEHSAFSHGATHITVAGHDWNKADGAQAMGIDWMTMGELAQAIPPAYTEYLGRQMLQICLKKA